MNHLVKQGVPAWSDNYAITKAAGAKKLDVIHEFINYTYSLPYKTRFAAVTGNNGVLTYARARSSVARAAGLNKKKLGFTMIPLTKLGNPFFREDDLFPRCREPPEASRPLEPVQARHWLTGAPRSAETYTSQRRRGWSNASCGRPLL
jgi:hypothetical protein